MYSTDCLAARKNPSRSILRLLGLYWHIRWDIGGEIGLICFSCHLNGRSLSRGKELTGPRSQWANSQTWFIGFLLQTLCLMWLASSASEVKKIPQKILIKRTDWLSFHDKLSATEQCCRSPGTFITHIVWVGLPGAKQLSWHSGRVN